MIMPKILARFGYRTVLISNTIILGLLILSFAIIGVGTPGLAARAPWLLLRLLQFFAIQPA